MPEYDTEALSDTKQLGGERRVAIIFPSTCFLFLLSIAGTMTVIFIYVSQLSNSTVDICSIFLVAASVVSFVFISLYILAARRNEDVGEIRPPMRPWHNACFVTLRINAILWFVSSTTSGYAAHANYSDSNLLYTIQIIEVTFSTSALITTVLILSLLERCHKPFETPAMARMRPKLICRVSAFEDLLLDRSVSQRSSFNPDLEKAVSGKNWLEERSLFEQTYPIMRRKSITSSHHPPLPQSSHNSSLSESLHDGDSNTQWATSWKSAALKYPKAQKPSRVRRAYSLNDSPHEIISESTRNAPLRRTASDYSMSGSGCSSTAVSAFSSSRSSSRALPSSSISDSSYRSPLSIMRTAAFPEISVQPDLRFFQMRGFTSFNDMKTSFHQTNLNLQCPHPIAVSNRSHPRPATVLPLHLQKRQNPPPFGTKTRTRHIGLQHPPRAVTSLPQTPVPRPLRNVRRKTSDMRIPGAFSDVNSENPSQSRAMEIHDTRDIVSQHVQMIEAAIFEIARKRSDSESRIARPSIAKSQEGLVTSHLQESLSSRESGSSCTLSMTLGSEGDYTLTTSNGSDISERKSDLIDGEGRHSGIFENIVEKAWIPITSHKSPQIPELDFDTAKLWS